MTAAILERLIETALQQEIEGAPVYDADGNRLGLVETVDQQTRRFTLLEAGYPLGLLGASYDVPAEWVHRAAADRVELAVPAEALADRRQS